MTAAMLQTGAVIFASASSAAHRLASSLAARGNPISVDPLPTAFLNQYVGEVSFYPEQDFQVVDSVLDVYDRGVESGILSAGGEASGAVMVRTIEGEEAMRLWRIYEAPLREISISSPINAGYDQDGFLEALANPTIAKVLNRQDGQITTLALFGTDLSAASWLNVEYFAYHYPEAYLTGNILLFLGIVSDELLRGYSYSQRLISLLVKVGEVRDSKAIITFECNEVSSTYLPQLVDESLRSSNIVSVSGLQNPIAHQEFLTIQLQ